jgi:5'-3' exonuclease
MAAAPLALARGQAVVLVDASYYVFYRHFATHKWFAYKQDAAPPPAEFRDALVRHAHADVANWKKRYGLPKTSHNVVFCQDCSRNDIWRRDLFPDYKANREDNPGFDAASFGVLFDWVRSQGYPLVHHARLEADDVACLVHGRLRAEPDACGAIAFITNDHDYLQIKDDRNVVHRVNGTDVMEAGRRKGTADIDVKIAMGDASDNISQALSPAQVRHFAALDAAARGAYVRSLGREAAFERNRQLMHWACIPEALQLAFHAAWAVEWVGPSVQEKAI